MAFSAVLRRANPSRLVVGSLAFARSFHIQLSPFLNPNSLNSQRNIDSRSLVSFPLSNFSSTAGKPSSDAELLRVIDAEIKCTEECHDHNRVEEVPEGFPFEIQNEKGKSTITLRRSYLGENIEVLVSMPSLVSGLEPVRGRRVDPGDEEGEKERPSQSSIPLTINFKKNEGHGLEFFCTAYPDELVIDSLSFKDIKESGEDMLAYQGPDFSDLDENLQRSFNKYLELRGISALTTNFLHEYMINKDCREYLLWLRDLKKIIEK